MKINFHKYQGTGNDFIVLDDLNRDFPSNDKQLIKKLCDRKFGIGSDGILLIQKDDNTDFYLDFINPDGSRSFCGNGSRCAVMFAHNMGIINDNCNFSAIDGIHEAKIEASTVELKMSDVSSLIVKKEAVFMDTGSPHHIIFEKNIDDLDIKNLGAEIRYSEEYGQVGVNVNFVESRGHGIYVRTYERGVEEETLSCGTGVTAAALATAYSKGNNSPIQVNTKGGELNVLFNKKEDGFDNIWLCGPAEFVFQGSFNP